MTVPARELPEEEPSFTGREGNAGMPSPDPTVEPGAAPTAAVETSTAGRDADPAHADLPGEKLAEETEVADVELAHEDVAADPPGVAYAAPPAEPGAPAGVTGNGAAVDAVADSRWSKVQAMFVDDPRSAVTEAAALADEAVEAFIATVREQQASLASSWQAEGADTEQLRAAFRGYRTFWNGVTGLSRPG
jgi:hypothetical protein